VTSPSLTALAQPLVLLCLERRDKATAAELLLRQAGIRALITFDVRDGLRLVEQEMPHLVVVEPRVEGGGAVVLFDKIRSQAAFDAVSILAHLSKVSREELTPLAQRKFGAFLTGAIDDKAFVATIRTQLDALNAVSPYLVRLGPMHVTSAIEVAVLGTVGDHVVVRLPWDTPPGAIIRLTSREGARVDAEVAWSLQIGQDHVTFLPRRHVRGPGRKWLLQSTPLASIEDALRRESRAMVLVDHDEEGRSALGQFFGSHGWTLTTVPSVGELSEKIQRLQVGALLVRLTSAHLTAEAKALAHVSTGIRDWATILLAPSAVEGPWRHLPSTSGVGTLLDTMSAAMLKPADFASLMQTPAGLARLDLDMHVLGCDETGLLLRSVTPIARGSRLSLTGGEHLNRFASLLPSGGMQVSACVNDPDQSGVWLLRADLVAPGTSKLRSWDRVRKTFSA
jgi:hypothetical protein